MKTAVSIPDDVYEQAERMARQSKRSRSEIYSTALAEYLARHTPDRVTAAMNDVLSSIAQGDSLNRSRLATVVCVSLTSNTK